MLSIKSKDGLFAFTLNGAGLEICANCTKTFSDNWFPLLCTSIQPSSKANHNKNCHCLKFCRLREFQTSCGEKPLLRNPVKHRDTARTLWVLEFEKIGVKSCFLCNTFRWSRKTQNHDSRSSLWKSHLQKGETEQRKKIRILLKMAKCATFESHVLDFSAPVTPQWRLLLKTNRCVFSGKSHSKVWPIASRGLKQRNLKYSQF